MQMQLEDLGERAKSRPAPSLHGTMAAVGGAAIFVGMMIITGDKFISSGSTSAGVFSGILLVLVGYVVLLRLPARVRTAGVAMVALGIIATAGYLVVDGFDSPRTLLLLLAVGFTAAYFAPPSRGDQVFAVGGLGSLWLLILDAVSDSGGGDFGMGGPGFLSPLGEASDTTVAYVSMAIGVGLLLLVRRLDIDGYSGLATAMVIVGDLAFVVGVFGLVGEFDSDAISSLIVVSAGVLLSFVGSSDGRRFTTWTGGLLSLVGLTALLAEAFSDSSSGVAPGVAFVAVGSAIVLGIAYIEKSGDQGNTPPASSLGGPL